MSSNPTSLQSSHSNPTSSYTEKNDKPADAQENLVGDYIIGAKIGQGSFATVYKAQHKTTKQTVAVKSVLRSKLTRKLLENLESEISILRAIRHPHIVGLIECQKTNTHIYLVMEYCSMGDLSQYIKRTRTSKSSRGPGGGMPERVVRHFLKQLASALEFLRSKNLVHRDIKPQNLLLIPPEESGHHDVANADIPVLKVADFGFARFLPNASLADTLCGSPLYMGPEILSYKKYDAKADLWSVGAVLFEMITGRPPFRAQNHLELLKKIQENNDNIRFPDEKLSSISNSPNNRSLVIIGDDMKDLIRKLLKKNPVERMTFEEFFNHPAVTQDIAPINTLSLTPSLSSPARQRSLSHYRDSLSPSSGQRPRHDSAAAYEAPPFAKSSSPPRQPRPLSSPVRSPQKQDHEKSPTKTHLTSDENLSPLYARGRPIRHKSRPRADSHENGTMIKRPIRDGDAEEEVLREYVVLDRRIIETNQFADEIDASPRADTDGALANYRPSLGQIAIPTKGLHEQTTQVSPSSLGSTPPFAHNRERKISVGSAGSALAKALSMASVRLFGTSNSPPTLNKLQRHFSGSPRNLISPDGMDPEEERMMKQIEKAACMAHAVAKFADLKFEQLVSGRSMNEAVIAEEAMVLHIKALSLLQLGMDTARQYWSRLSEEQVKPISIRLNDVVQWIRDRFNECLDRATFAGKKCEQDDQYGTGACVEKLLYDRALETSRAAAVHELVGENISECEQDYQMAIWMLEAILAVQPDEGTTIEDDDKHIINKFIASIQHRVVVLKRKQNMDGRFEATNGTSDLK
ncbi:kinase-like domain-containing protein [Radiomyces spectabilis]|uniref:kinase-like domain-containing protein n=1 Tax=Radiomyces spectabilis TaxID=64574 RepID=UPI002220D3AF|nr:kinase-like domain-containing protein [Radiomyces spectabilis]KAI8381091.1 kinase-like domain-containing protein [Radiomyces spectabilis]